MALSVQPEYVDAAGPDEVFRVRGKLKSAPPPEPRCTWRTPTNTALLVLTMGVGGAFLTVGKIEESPDTPVGSTLLEVIGGLLFNAGQTPFFLAIIAIITGFGPRRKGDALRAGIALLIFCIGVLVLYLALRDEDGDVSDEDLMEVRESFFNNLFEAGAIYFVAKLFFLTEDPEKKLKRLLQMLREALTSPGNGLAASYFYNFVQPVVKEMAASRGAPHPIVNLEGTRGDYRLTGPSVRNHPPTLHIIVPRDLPAGDEARNIRAMLADAKGTGRILEGSFQQAKGSHRRKNVRASAVHRTLGPPRPPPVTPLDHACPDVPYP